MNEVWKPVSGYETLYGVSNQGRVMNLNTQKPLRTRSDSKGYARVNLSKEGCKKTFRMHRLVADHFLPNPDGLLEVNHINENKQDNRAENLEWCSREYNVNYGTRTDRQRQKLSKPVVQLSKSGERVSHYPSLVEAERTTGFNRSSISACCRGERNQAYGYQWKYAYE